MEENGYSNASPSISSSSSSLSPVFARLTDNKRKLSQISNTTSSTDSQINTKTRQTQLIKKSGRPRRSCEHCRKIKRSCDGNHPCARCVGKGKPPHECIFPDAIVSEAYALIKRQNEALSQDYQIPKTDFSDLIEQCLAKAPLSDEQVHDLIRNRPAKW